MSLYKHMFDNMLNIFFFIDLMLKERMGASAVRTRGYEHRL